MSRADKKLGRTLRWTRNKSVFVGIFVHLGYAINVGKSSSSLFVCIPKELRTDLLLSKTSDGEKSVRLNVGSPGSKWSPIFLAYKGVVLLCFVATQNVVSTNVAKCSNYYILQRYYILGSDIFLQELWQRSYGDGKALWQSRITKNWLVSGWQNV